MHKEEKIERANKLEKFLDYYLGIPIVLFLRLFKRKKAFKNQVNSIGLLKTSAIGDTVLLTGIIADLRKHFSSAKITLFTGNSNYEFAKSIKILDEVVLLQVNNPFSALKSIRKSHFSIIIDFGSWPRLNSILTFFSNSDLKIGFKTKGQYRHYNYDYKIEHSNCIHEFENYRNLIKKLGVNPSSPPTVLVEKADINKITHKLFPYIILHPWPGGTKSHLKEWSIYNWVIVAKYILNSGYYLFITGAPNEYSKTEEIINLVAINKNRIVNTAGNFSLSETIALIKHSELIVCVNTGIMHIAAGLNVPLIALHGPTSSKRWGPLSKNAVIINSKIDNCGYLNLGFEYPPNPPDCMGAIRPEEIIKEINFIIQGKRKA
jgi:heptosyltransferase I